MKPLILYHSPCMDGLFAAVAAWGFFGDQAEYQGVNYNDELGREIFNDRDVYMLDFSVKRDELEDIARYALSVIVIDHHESAERELEAFHHFDLGDSDSLERALNNSQSRHGVRIAVHFDMKQSGAALSWNHFQTDEMPWAIALVQDRDLWRFELPGSRSFHEFLMLETTRDPERTLEGWFTVMDLWQSSRELRSEALTVGSVLLEYQAGLVKTLADKAVEGSYQGTPAMIVNAPGYMASDLGNELCSRDPKRIAVIYQVTPAGVNVSLRSHRLSGFNVSELAATRGGGGHKNAAGCFYPVPGAIFNLGGLFNWENPA